MLAAFGFGVAVVTIAQGLHGAAFPSGWATLIVLISLFSGTQLICMGIIGEYLGAIFDEVKGRPHYIIDEAVNIGPSEGRSAGCP